MGDCGRPHGRRRAARIVFIACVVLAALGSGLAGCTVRPLIAAEPGREARRIGAVFVFHGGSESAGERSSWESTLQIFAYDPNSPVYRDVIWNAALWPRILAAGDAPKELKKYQFSYGRIGGVDPATRITQRTFERFRDALESRERELGVDFVVDYVSWLAPDPGHHAYPRLIYEPRVPGGSPVTYCGAWPGCDPQRFNVDGTTERLLAADVEEIVMIDLTTAGVRFFKSWDVVNLARQVAARHAARTGKSVPVHWVNDPTDLMTASYPADPGWTLSLGEPKQDRRVPLEGRPNPVSGDPRLAQLHAIGIVSQLSPAAPPARTGVLLVNHATRLGNRWFDPKIDDTLVLNRNIERALLASRPGLDPENIVGAWFGRREPNPKLAARPGAPPRLERTREMRGENLGDAWLYETDALPQGKWGYLYWDALERLKRRGVEHIVVAFPQIMVDSVLNLVEVPNQIARELGYRTWRDFSRLDFAAYPGVGHPFADYWGNWVDTHCPAPRSGVSPVPCCFEMGGCADGRPYPPPRTTPLDQPRDDLDPSLAYDVPAYGHLGYDPARGPPNDTAPVQDQYRGTWVMWRPPNDDPEVGRFLADKLVEHLRRSRGAAAAPAIGLHGLK